MDEARQSESFGTIYRVIYAQGLRAFYTEFDYQREARDSHDPARLPEHRIMRADAFHDARFEAHYGGWWMLTGVNAEGRRVDLADTGEPELATLALSPAIARQVGRETTTFGQSDESPGEGSTMVTRLRELSDKVRDLFNQSRQRDHGMGR
jgi:hypothetical protein